MCLRRRLGNKINGLWPKEIKRGIAVLFAAVLVLGGCSKEDQPPPKGKNKVVVAIVKPVPESVEAEPVEKAGPREVPSTGEQKAEPREESAPLVPSALEVKKVTPPTAKEEASSSNEAAVAGSSGATTTPAASKEKKVTEPEKGVARVGEGESLSAFAAREDTCGDPLKWTSVYRLNTKHLAMLRTWKDITEKPLQSGLPLRYLSPVNNPESPVQAKPWVVTVRSWRSPGRLAAPAIKLIESGFHVYITRAEVKGKQWLRLRVGFYPNKSEAMAARDRIREILANNDSWLARAGKGELEEFGK